MGVGSLPFVATAGILVGLFALKYPVIILASLALSLLATANSSLRRISVDRVGLMVLLNYGYWLASGIVFGGVKLADLLSPRFYGSDGRVFLFYLPLLMFSVCILTDAEVGRLMRLLKWLTVAMVVLFVIWLAAAPALVSGGRGGSFWGLSTSHHGSGAFAGMLAIFFLIMGAGLGRWRERFLGLGALLAVVGSGSRTTMVGLLVVGLWYAWRHGAARHAGKITLLVVALVAATASLVPRSFERIASLASFETLASMERTLRYSDWEPGEAREDLIEGTQWNVLVRMLYWEYATRRFAGSPVVGIGFGRYNDVGVGLDGQPYLAYVAWDARQRVVSATTAHNSYLHVLAESGVFGLFLLLALWWMLKNRLKRATAEFAWCRTRRTFLTACESMTVFALVMAVFGHGLGAPALGMAPVTVIALGMGWYRGVTLQKRVSRLSAGQGPTV